MNASSAMARRIGSFAGLPLLSSLAPFLLLPYIARVGGEGTWNALAVGQAAGSLAAIFVALGWTLSGPARVAGTPGQDGRRHLYALSLLTRSVAFVIALPLLVVVSVAFSQPEHVVETLLMAAAQATAGLSPAWYCIAVGKARLIAQYDVIPRILATLACIPILLATGLIIVYPLAILIGGLVGTFFFTLRHSRRVDYRGVSLQRVGQELWALRAASGTTLAAGAYAATPVIIVAAAALPAGLAAFVSAEKLYRIGMMAIGALGSSLQGWVAEIGSDHRKRRKFSLLSHSFLGLAGFLGFSLLGPSVSQLLFGEKVAADGATCFWFGLAFLFVSLNTATGSHWLVPLGQLRVVFWSTIAGAVIGLPAMFALSSLMQGAGGALGLAIGELVVCMVQGGAILSHLRASETQPLLHTEFGETAEQ